MAELFLDSGPRMMRGRLKELFTLAQAEGQYAGGAPEDLAQAFLGLIVSDYHLRQALGQAPDLAEDDIEAHCPAGAAHLPHRSAGRPCVRCAVTAIFMMC